MALRVGIAIDIEKKRADIVMVLMELVEKEPKIVNILRESAREDAILIFSVIPLYNS